LGDIHLCFTWQVLGDNDHSGVADVALIALGWRWLNGKKEVAQPFCKEIFSEPSIASTKVFAVH
jgi:hypothetical protein